MNEIDKIIDFIKGLMQPLITVISVIILFALLQQGYDPDKMFYVAGGVLLFWFGYTGLKNFTFTGNGNKPTVPEPPANNQPVAILPPIEPPSVTAPVEDEDVDTPEGIDFNADEFQKGIEKAVVPIYTTSNPSTLFYAARTRFINTDWTAEGHKEAALHVLKLARESFKYIWGLPAEVEDPLKYATEHLNDASGCATCSHDAGCTYPDLRFKAMQLGQGYYVAYLDLVEMEKYAS